MKARARYWIGMKSGVYTVFQAIETPTEQTHGHLYGAVIGPFRTHRGATSGKLYAAILNPSWQTSETATHIARR